MCQLKCQGGVLHLNGGTLKVSYGKFLNNSAKGFFSEGGVFQLLDSTVSFSYNTFLHNTVEGRGGIISAKRAYILSTSNIFDQNSATMEGGVFYTIESNLHSRDNDFSQNVAGAGGVMRILSGSVILDENYFENNTASNNGGVIFASETVITCHFNGNSAKNLGGMIHLLDNSYLIMINNEIFFNIAESGGVLSLSDVPDVTIIGSRFINNEVKLNGGVSVISGHYQTRMSISECEFAKNLAQQRGGVIYAPTGNLNASIQGSIFLYNSADEGGVLYARRCSIRFTAIVFSYNNASVGAVVYTVEKTHMLMKNVTVPANTAKMGVMYLIETTGIFLGFSEFSNNFGSLFAINSIISISNSSKFVKCSKGITLRFSGTSGVATPGPTRAWARA